MAATALLGIALAGAASPAWAKLYMTQQEALDAAFPGGEKPRRETLFLTDEELRSAEKECGERPASKVVTRYVRDSVTAYFDTHVVRTLPETIMVVVSPRGDIERIDVLSFDEPEDYLARPRWLEQLRGRALDEELSLRRGVRPLTGATLSARAVVAASRRVLAAHKVLAAREQRR